MSVQPHLLGPVLDTSAAGPLRHALLARIERGEPMHIDGAEVVRVGQAALQVLASAGATAAARGIDFRIDNPSEPLVRMATLARLETVLDPAHDAGF